MSIPSPWWLWVEKSLIYNLAALLLKMLTMDEMLPVFFFLLFYFVIHLHPPHFLLSFPLQHSDCLMSPMSPISPLRPPPLFMYFLFWLFCKYTAYVWGLYCLHSKNLCEFGSLWKYQIWKGKLQNIFHIHFYNVSLPRYFWRFCHHYLLYLLAFLLSAPFLSVMTGKCNCGNFSQVVPHKIVEVSPRLLSSPLLLDRITIEIANL